MPRRMQLSFIFGLVLSFVMAAARGAWAEEPLKIGYSDWPGYVAFEIAINKGWLKEAGVNAEFQWFDYSASLDAFSASKLDGVSMASFLIRLSAG